MLVRIAHREDPDQTTSTEMGLHCLSGIFGKQLAFKILDHLPVVLKHKPVHFHV